MDNKNVITAINKSILEMPAIAKDSKNPQGWKYRSIDAIIDHCKNVIAKNGLVVIPETINATTKVDVIEKEKYDSYAKKNVTVISRLSTSSVLVCYKICHTSGEMISAIVPGESQDYGDKSMSQAETFAFKSMLSKVFLLGFEEDADAKNIDTSESKIEPEKPKAEIKPEPKKEEPLKKLDDLKKVIIASPLVGDKLIEFIRKAKTNLDEKYNHAIDYKECVTWLNEKIKELEGEKK